jgi:hypothetical protein
MQTGIEVINMNKTDKIRELNDEFRKQLPMYGILLTSGVNAREDRHEIVEQVRSFNQFNEDNDPYGEHDFGSFVLNDGQKIFWKMDYYDKSLNMHSPNPTDPQITRRILTIMLSEEY